MVLKTKIKKALGKVAAMNVCVNPNPYRLVLKKGAR